MVVLNKEAEVETVLYRPEDKKVLVVVEVGQFYGHPANVFSYEGSIEEFLIEHPDYEYDNPDSEE